MNAWLQVLTYLKTKVNTQSYQTWLKPTRFSHVEEQAIVVCVPNREFQESIQEHFSGIVADALTHLDMGFREIRYVLAENAERKRSGNGEEPKVVQRKLDFDSVEDHQLNLKYTFDTFVMRYCNQFAHAAARAVAESPPRLTTRCFSTEALVWERLT